MDQKIRKAWHHDGVIWVRFPSIVHGLEVEEAKELINEINKAIDKHNSGINEDGIL